MPPGLEGMVENLPLRMRIVQGCLDKVRIAAVEASARHLRVFWCADVQRQRERGSPEPSTAPTLGRRVLRHCIGVR